MKIYKTTLLDENNKIILVREETERHYYRVEREIIEK